LALVALQRGQQELRKCCSLFLLYYFLFRLSAAEQWINSYTIGKEEWEVLHSSFQFFSFALWQITSIEKLNASAKAVHSSHACFPKATTIIAKQNRLAITVRAFFSVKYFLRKGEVDDSNFFMCTKIIAAII